MKKEWKVRSVILLSQIAGGIVWICVGVSNLFEENQIVDKLTLVVLLAACVFTFLPYIGRQEEPDERSRRNLEKAQAMGCTVLVICLIAAFAAGEIWNGFSVPIQVLAPVILGVGFLAVGLYFSRLETRGEPWQDW